jgi:DNA polymerase-3 subunit delta'
MTPLLDTVSGQDTAVESLRRALAGGRTHHAYLFEGPEGVGKERAAFGLAQALVCTESTASGSACGTCSACSRAVPKESGGLALHPDVIVLGRGLYEPAQIGRKTPESKELSIDQVRTLVLARAAFPPHEGRAKVFVVRAADELSVSAANALLKTLEEPGNATHFILLTSRKAALLSTIRSRTLALRFGPLPPSVVERILLGRGVEAGLAAKIAETSDGSMESALLATDDEARAERETFVGRVKAAIEAADAGDGYALAEEGKKGKADLPVLLEALAIAFAKDARDALKSGSHPAPEVHAKRHELVMQALRRLRGNGSAQLVMESLVLGLRAL